MKLKDWAKKQGITYLTAYNWFKAGKIPNAIQYDTGTIIVKENDTIKNNGKTVIYCRVSSNAQKKIWNHK